MSREKYGERFPAKDLEDGTLGNVTPERFWNCADIKIVPRGGGGDPPAEPAPVPAPEPVPVPAPEQPAPTPAPPAESGTAVTTRYFDGCKMSCSWRANVATPFERGPVKSCGGPVGPEKRQAVLDGDEYANVCGGGGDTARIAYACLDQAPFTDPGSGQRFGFAAANFPCCQCYELTFERGALGGETMVVQVTNSGGDLGDKHFDLLVPGGGFGLFNGVADNAHGRSDPDYPADHLNGDPLFPDADWGEDLYRSWGKRFGGVASSAACDGLPEPARSGCRWRFLDNGLRGADNPDVAYRRVQCPKALTDVSGCKLAGGDALPEHGAGGPPAEPAPEEPEAPEAPEAPEEEPVDPEPVEPDPEFPPAEPWAACGGLSNLCREDRACTTCGAGPGGQAFSCEKGNRWYWQCVPGKPKPEPAPAPAPAPGGQVDEWGTCGGINLCGMAGACRSCAKAGNTCSCTSDWYCQCVP